MELLERLWADFLEKFASGPMSGTFYAVLTLAVRLPMRLASNAIARLDTNLTGTTSAPLMVLFAGNFAVWLVTFFVHGLNEPLLYGSVTAAGASGLFERKVVAKVVAKQDAAIDLDKSGTFLPKEKPTDG